MRQYIKLCLIALVAYACVSCATTRSDISEYLQKSGKDPEAAASAFTKLDKAIEDIESTIPQVRADALTAMTSIDLQWHYAEKVPVSHQRLLALLDGEEKSPRLPVKEPLPANDAAQARIELRAHALNDLGRLKLATFLPRFIAPLGDAAAGADVQRAAINGIAGEIELVEADRAMRLDVLHRLAAQLLRAPTFAPAQTEFLLAHLLDLDLARTLLAEKEAGQLPIYVHWNGRVLAALDHHRPVDASQAADDVAKLLALIAHADAAIRTEVRVQLETFAPSAYLRRLSGGEVMDLPALEAARDLARDLPLVASEVAVASTSDALLTLPGGRLVIGEGASFAGQWPELRRQALVAMLASSRGAPMDVVRQLWAAAYAVDPLTLAGWIEPDLKAFPPGMVVRYQSALGSHPALASNTALRSRLYQGVAACLVVPSAELRQEIASALMPIDVNFLARSALATMARSGADETAVSFDALALIAIGACQRALSANPAVEIDLTLVRPVFTHGGAGVLPASALLAATKPDILAEMLIAERLSKGTVQASELMVLADLVAAKRLDASHTQAVVEAMSKLIDDKDEEVALVSAACVATASRFAGKPVDKMESHWASVRQLASLSPGTAPLAAPK